MLRNRAVNPLLEPIGHDRIVSCPCRNLAEERAESIEVYPRLGPFVLAVCAWCWWRRVERQGRRHSADCLEQNVCARVSKSADEQA